MTSTAVPRFLPAGDCALVVELGDAIDDAANARVLALAARLRARYTERDGVQAVVATYRSLTLTYDPQRLSFGALCQQVRECLEAPGGATAPVRRWRVPVCYGDTHGEDLATLATAHGLTPGEVIAMHSAPVYRIYMIGFLPGFAYLGGLDTRLHTPRRAVPRTATPAGSVNIGGQQTAVASVAGPSGWHLVGRTPWRTFDLRRTDPFLFAAGDEVIFTPIDAGEFARLEARFADPGCVPQPETLHEAPEEALA